jgi:hypothetical protein
LDQFHLVGQWRLFHPLGPFRQAGLLRLFRQLGQFRRNELSLDGRGAQSPRFEVVPYVEIGGQPRMLSLSPEHLARECARRRAVEADQRREEPDVGTRDVARDRLHRYAEVPTDHFGDIAKLHALLARDRAVAASERASKKPRRRTGSR